MQSVLPFSGDLVVGLFAVGFSRMGPRTEVPTRASPNCPAELAPSTWWLVRGQRGRRCEKSVEGFCCVHFNPLLLSKCFSHRLSGHWSGFSCASGKWAMGLALLWSRQDSRTGGQAMWVKLAP